jgi:GDPmannose 4,6-dehydratase
VSPDATTQRRALLTGLTGQDGSFLAELLLEQGYEVIGMIRRDRAEPLGCAEHLRGRVELIAGDLLDAASLTRAVADLRPDELYHLAAPSFVPDSWRQPARTMAAVVGAAATLLEAVRQHSPTTRTFISTSGAMFGAAPESPQDEQTPCRPESPYATAKLAAHQLVGQLREHDGLFACSGILYNHESERRPEAFVTRKIARAVAQIKLGVLEAVHLGDLDAVRDWSFAGDVMYGAWLTLQQDRPDDFIFASGEPHTVRELAEIAFARVGLDASEYIRVDPALLRAPEPTPLVGDPSKARERLRWHPTVSFDEIVWRMVDADVDAMEAV